MKAIEIQNFLLSAMPNWKRPANTVDTIKSGDENIEVTGIAVGWMGYLWALERAVELGCNVFITHEPTFYHHHDYDYALFKLKAVQEKQQFIRDHGLVIIRCHDLWDRMEKMGIPDAWGDILGFKRLATASEFIRIYQIKTQTAHEVARHVAVKTRCFGQPAVQLIGSGDHLVSKISIGTGAITPFFDIVRQHSIDLAICTDDGINYWRDGAYAIDMGIPIIVVNHPVSEEAGIIQLAKYIRLNFPVTPVHHIPQQCMYDLITPAGDLFAIRNSMKPEN